MSPTLRDELQAALGSAYAIERELGGGGMGRVFLATETGLGRRVVVKILAPELVLGVSAERFRREIELAARLQHPHIVPVHAAGQAGNFLYYTMPYVEGESLRGRLTREGELPVSDTVGILNEVTRALAYAHRRGIVHRDIKPDNILLAEGEAQVTDFGIAKAISASAREATLTSIGLALGTPAYMAPEQAAADPTADHRVDLYALGVVAYEMLAGQPPFAGRTHQQLIAAHATEAPISIEQRRPSVPGPLADLIARLLAKHAADRPQGADEVLTALQAATTPASPTVPLPSPREIARRGRWLVAGGVAALALLVTVAFLRSHEKPAGIDRGVIAIAPFSVTGADSSLGYLREGMVDLLAAKLSGTAALRSADPRTLLAAWTRAARGAGELSENDAVRVAAGLGAGRMVEGEVVGSRGRVSMSARIVDVPNGSVRARASAEGSPDSLTQLVDHLAATLLVLGSGESEQHLAGLTSTSLPALRAYLDGEALLRRGTFGEASKKFLQAYQIDSTFALAGVGAARAGEWGFGYEAAPVEAAWRHRDRLSPRDLACLTVYLDRGYPAPAGAQDEVKAAERFLELAPDSPDAWYKLADNLFHFGMLAAVPEALRRAEAAFARSLALDSSYAPALQHLSEIATFFDDTVGVIRGRSLLHRIDSMSAIAVARQWHVAAWLGDTTEIRRLLKSDSVFRLAPNYLFFYSLDVPLDTFGMEDLYRRKYAQAVTTEERYVSGIVWNRYELARGRPGKGPTLPAEWSEVQRENLAALDAIFADGDSSQGARAARALERLLGTAFAASDGSAVLARYAVGQYALNLGNLNHVRRAIADLRQATPHPDSTWQADDPRGYALLLAAQLAAREHSPEAPRLLSQLDSVLANPLGTFDYAHPPLFSYGNFVAARLHEEAGDPAAALAAVRRRLIGVATYPHYVEYRREEGRLAALVGDTAGAIRAYRHYLSLRSDPEPRFRAEADTVRTELSALLRAGGKP